MTWFVCDMTHSQCVTLPILLERVMSHVYWEWYDLTSATHCNSLQRHSATHCNTVQDTARHYTTLQHTATHCNSLQLTGTHCNKQWECAIWLVCNKLQHTATNYNILQHITTYCNVLQHDAFLRVFDMTQCNSLQLTMSYNENVRWDYCATHYNTLQHTATYCNILQHIATHCNVLQRTKHMNTGDWRRLQRRSSSCGGLL